MVLAVFISVAAAIIYLLWHWRRHNVIFILAIGLLIALPLYNSWILSRCFGDCSIRIDLIVVAPLILLATAFAIAEAFRRWRAKPTNH
jgi:hypothetical protein